MDLYNLPLTGTPQRMCGGNNGTEGGEACVLFQPIAGADAFAISDSKNPDAPALRFTRAELTAAGMVI